jgi:tRNA pseudouridine13 synthase
MYEIKRSPDDFIVEEITPREMVLEAGKDYPFVERSRGEQLICLLQKSNWDTNLAIKALAERLHVSRKRIGFAGTKDKRALTTQRISLWKIKQDEAAALRIPGMRLLPLKYSSNRIELGDLWGNRFTIRVFTDQQLGQVPKKIPNYYGVQRFGEIRPLTHLVGKAILQGDFEKAVKLYLAEVYAGESEEPANARRRLAQDWDYKAALQYFPKGLGFERTMLGHLALQPTDYVGALRKLPKFLMIMFVHAYQSYLFNLFLDKVLERGLDYKTGPLYGYKSRLENALEAEVLGQEGISLGQFLVRGMPEASSKGERRDLFVRLKGFRVKEEGEGFVVLQFSLPKGCYATTVIDWLFGNRSTGRKE